MIPKNIKNLQHESRHLTVYSMGQNTFMVESTTTPTANHIVTVEFDEAGETVRARCTCPWAIHNGIACTHVMAALEHMANYKERTLSFWRTFDEARRQKNKLFHLTDGRDQSVWITSRND
jgi:hypothetical protein